MEILTSFNNSKNLIYGEIHELLIVKKGVVFPLSLYLEKDCEELVVFFPGAFDREKSAIPKYQRSTYAKRLKKNTVALFDPTLFLDSEIGIGWFQGVSELDYTLLLNEILHEIVETINIEYKNILFFATSAGGIPASRISKNYEDSTLYLGNIQTNLLNYYKGAVNKIVEHCYKGIDQDVITKKYYDRVSMVNIDANIKMYYAQNESDVFHYKNHFLPFISQLESKKYLNYKIFTYSNAERGHGPLGVEIETTIIDSLFNGGINNVLNELSFELYAEKK